MRRKSIRGRRGAALVETSLSLLGFLAVLLAAADFNYAVFARATLRHSVREAVRYAATGRVDRGLRQDEEIRRVVRENSLGLISERQALDAVRIRYFQPDGAETPANRQGNFVEVAVEGYPVMPMAALIHQPLSLKIDVKAMDVVEPYPGYPPMR